MPVIGGNTPTINVQVPVPTPAAMPRQPRPAPAAPPQPIPQAAPPSLQPVPSELGPVPPGIEPPQATAFILPWKPQEQGLQQMRRYARRPVRGWEPFIRAIAAEPHNSTNALAFADWLQENGFPAAEDVVRRDLADWGRRNPDNRRVHIQRTFNRNETKGPWSSRFYVYAPMATHGYGGDPYSYTSLSFRHPDDPRQMVGFGHWGSEQEGADALTNLEKEGHEPYSQAAGIRGLDVRHEHNRFRAARPELFNKPQQMRRLPKRRLRRYARTATTDNLLAQMEGNPEHLQPGSNLRMIAADAFDDAEEPHVAEALRSSDPISIGKYHAHREGERYLQRVVNGTTYKARTPKAAIDALERSRQNHSRIHISYGYTSHDEDDPNPKTRPATGMDWLEESGAHGTVGRSMGPRSIPLMIASNRSMGGGGILDDSIVRIREMPSGRVIYQHPQYHHGDLEIRHGSHPQYPVEVFRNGGVHRRFRTMLAARMWAKRMGVRAPIRSPESGDKYQRHSRRA